jgi:hypothetical protein
MDDEAREAIDQMKDVEMGFDGGVPNKTGPLITNSILA